MDFKKVFVNGEWKDTGEYLDVTNPFNHQLFGRVCITRKAVVEEAIEAAEAAKKVMAKLTTLERGAILDRVAEFLMRDQEEIANIIKSEAGKPISLARGEVQRSSETFKFAADEARRLSGELIPFDAALTGANRFGYFKRYPLGVIGAITPFNFPLNLVAHKLAPAVAAGCPVVLKPASTTPLTSVKLVELMLEAGLPKGGINLVVGSGREVGDVMVTSDKISMITFTGSPGVGLGIKQKAGIKKVTLELGSNSAAIVHEDADIAFAVNRLLIGCFAYSGQVCISTQRIYIHESRYEEFKTQFLQSMDDQSAGDPDDDKRLVGPMILASEASRAETWVQEALAAGATLLHGGKRVETLLEPTILENTDHSMKIVSEEVFGPVVSLMKYKTLEEAIELVNDSQFGLQAGIFTNDIRNAFKAIDDLEVGGVMVNEMPTFRVDQMPYGGVKLSGTGREGARFAIEEMTEIKTVMINLN